MTRELTKEEETKRKEMNETARIEIANYIGFKILDDLTDRKGFQEVWFSLKEDVQNTIRATIDGIVCQGLKDKGL